MDDQRFDELARAVARGATRRGLLRGLAGGAAAGLLAVLRPQRLGADDDDDDDDDDDCRRAGRGCRRDGQCCRSSGLVCGPGGTCQAGCRVEGVFYAPGAPNPADSCESCQPTRRTRRFSAVRGCVNDLPLGAACAAAGECGSGLCVDGVCCDGPCGGQCEACNVAGSVGRCAPVTGAPVGGRAACASVPSQDNACGFPGGIPGRCAGRCDGVNRTACAPGPTNCGGTCCADCFNESQDSSGCEVDFVCCPEENLCPPGSSGTGGCCYNGEACVQTAVGGYRCVDPRRACGGVLCDAECCDGTCCPDGTYCSGGQCVPVPTTSCTTDEECGSGLTCVGITRSVRGEDGQVVVNPGTCCPSGRACAAGGGQPGNPEPESVCCPYATGCSGIGACCENARLVECGACVQCSPRGARIRF